MARSAVPALALAVAALVATVAHAAQETVDKVVAIVGDRPILLSSLHDEISLIKMQGGGAESAPDSLLRAQALKQLIDDQLVLVKADLSGVSVTDEEVDEALENTLNNMRRQFGSEAAFHAQLEREGLSEAALKSRYREDIKNQLKGMRLVEKEVQRKVEVTDDEMRAFFEKHKNEVPQLPERLELAQVIVRAKPSGASVDSARARIETVRARLAAGEPFEELAKVYSDGPSASKGGDLGSFKPREMEPTFAGAIAELEPGKISEPVETRVGIHLVRLDSRDGDMVSAHHIVALFSGSDADARAAARTRVDAAMAAIAAGRDFAEVAAEFSDDEATKDRGGRVGLFAESDLPEEYKSEILALAPGDATSPIEAEEGYIVFKLIGKEPARTPTFEELSKDLRDAVRQEKANQLYATWLEDLRKEVFVRILL